jgi:hypothetical protein
VLDLVDGIELGDAVEMELGVDEPEGLLGDVVIAGRMKEQNLQTACILDYSVDKSALQVMAHDPLC